MSAANLYRYFENKRDIGAYLALRCFAQKELLLAKVVQRTDLSAAEKLEAYLLTLLRYTHGTQMIMVTYDVSLITLQIIEEFLSELGFHLDNSLLMKLRRAFYYYAEDLQQDVMGCRRGRGNCTQDVFINRYRQLEHGCRDLRPDHWRQYH